ncbi:hypothetical protein AB2N04_08390 [Nitratireductor sp. GISD-1A_MAKvit]|uniref:hypothetical protein n=1 Tax=Nitratireductor sp. GISD-1A_MAKvit TaxID=3234198 RepID=UPI0034650416
MSGGQRNRSSLYLVDETAIEQRHDEIILSSLALQKHVAMINASLDCLDRALRTYDHRSTDELIVLRLAARCFNSGAAALRLARMGYYNQCLSLVRDLLEVTLLLDLFERDASTISEWTRASEAERSSKFSPFQVRMRLEDIEKRIGKAPLNRKPTYQTFCTYGTHASPESFVLISPDMMTKIGPFPDEGRLKAMIEEIVQHLTFAVIVFLSHLDKEHHAAVELRVEYYDRADIWANEFIRGKQPS